MKPSESRAEEARRKAQDHFTKAKERETAFVRERDKAEAAQAAKTAKLRALRLAKEAEDRQTEALKPAPVKRKRATPASEAAKDKPSAD